MSGAMGLGDRVGVCVWAMGKGGLGWVFDSVWAHG